ncbi:MAG: hypothetical protein NT085_05695 [candidate division SR1 bacterium]|nr:hypothetical protein [candidate division SR1 bacterium]
MLKDPINNEIFYIGKGLGNRVFQHAIAAINSDDDSDKLDRIRDILYKGKKIEYYIIRHGLSEDTAHEIEATLIDIFQGKQILKSDITNKISGFHSYKRGIMSINEIKQFYGGKEIEITDPVILININKLFKRNMTEEELYEATRKSRPLGKNRENAKYGLVHYKGIVREVYKINDWYPIPDHNGKIRWGFNGRIADETIRSKYINGLVKKYFTKGAAFPIRYINC